MSHSISYRILNTGLKLGLGLSLIAGVASAQQSPTEADMYCSGVATTQAGPGDTYLISGENASYRTVYEQLDRVYINRGADQGVKVGARFELLRPVSDQMIVKWFAWQPQLAAAMGPVYAALGRLRVVNVLAKTTIAEVEMSCEEMQRGDIVRPFTPRMAPVS